MLEQK